MPLPAGAMRASEVEATKAAGHGHRHAAGPYRTSFPTEIYLCKESNDGAFVHVNGADGGTGRGSEHQTGPCVTSRRDAARTRCTIRSRPIPQHSSTQNQPRRVWLTGRPQVKSCKDFKLD
eukprot:3801558-Rhodomonas_salina.1